MHNKLSMWRGHLLNKAGRATLTKFVLNASLVYPMQTILSRVMILIEEVCTWLTGIVSCSQGRRVV